VVPLLLAQILPRSVADTNPGLNGERTGDADWIKHLQVVIDTVKVEGIIAWRETGCRMRRSSNDNEEAGTEGYRFPINPEHIIPLNLRTKPPRKVWLAQLCLPKFPRLVLVANTSRQVYHKRTAEII